MTKRTSPYSEDFRSLAIQLARKLGSCNAASKLMGCYRTSIQNWIKLEDETGGLRPRRRARRRRKLEGDGDRILDEFVRQRPDLTLAELRDLLVAQGFDVSAAAVSRGLKLRKVTLKKSR